MTDSFIQVLNLNIGLIVDALLDPVSVVDQDLFPLKVG
jgi:hypothetical protein